MLSHVLQSTQRQVSDGTEDPDDDKKNRQLYDKASGKNLKLRGKRGAAAGAPSATIPAHPTRRGNDDGKVWCNGSRIG